MDRTVGWLTVRDLDLKVAASVVRLLTANVSGNPSSVEDTEKIVNGLLRRVIRQMCLKSESTHGWERRRIWLGRTLKMIQRAWLQFRLAWNYGQLKFR